MAVPQNVYVDVFSEYPSNCMTYYTHYRNMAAPQYVYVDDSSDNAAYWMTCHTHHINMVSPHYVCAGDPSNNPSDWKTYCTHCCNMASPHYVYVDDFKWHFWLNGILHTSQEYVLSSPRTGSSSFRVLFKTRRNNTKNPPMKRNESDTQIQYEVKRVHMKGWGGGRERERECVCVCERKKVQLQFHYVTI
jgi:hypothetical protein